MNRDSADFRASRVGDGISVHSGTISIPNVREGDALEGSDADLDLTHHRPRLLRQIDEKSEARRASARAPARAEHPEGRVPGWNQALRSRCEKVASRSLRGLFPHLRRLPFPKACRGD